MSEFSRVRLHTSPGDSHVTALSITQSVVQFAGNCPSSLLMYAKVDLSFLWPQLEMGSSAQLHLKLLSFALASVERTFGSLHGFLGCQILKFSH